MTDQDLDRYIDAPLSPTDRKLAHKFMAMMPANKRGDFVYVDNPGHIISNRAVLMTGSGLIVKTEKRSSQQSTRAQFTVKRGIRDYTSPCSPPHPYGGSGPYVRQVSQCGITGATGYVTIGCASSSILATEKGYTYMELRGGQGTLTEGGLQYASDTSISPWHRSPSTGPDTQVMYNYSVRYTCGQPIGVMQGITPDDNYSFTGVGLPDRSPAQYYLSPNASWHNSAWHYFNRTYDMTGTSIDPAGMSTVCGNCSVSRVTTIGQTFENFSDGSRFGVFDTVNGRLAQVHWEQVSMGQLVQPCNESQTSSTVCSIKFNTDYRSWIGGSQFYPDQNRVQSLDRNSSQSDPYEVWDGIDLRPYTLPLSAGGPYTDPLPPSTITYAHVWMCDTASDGQMVMYYPGETDDNGNVIPSGVMEELTYRYDPIKGCM